MDKKDIINWLREKNEDKLSELWEMADSIRSKYVGEEVHLRGLIEISNYCKKNCLYCGIRISNKKLTRYRMEDSEILECVEFAKRNGYGTIVLQSGEDPDFTKEKIAELIKKIKENANVAITLSLGEQEKHTLELWKSAGANRYLLRFETSDETLFNEIHSSKQAKSLENRIKQLKMLKQLGYEAGSGIMIGIPYQTYESIANDILLFKQLDLDMIGIGPYIPHPDTPLGQEYLNEYKKDDEKFVPNTELMTYKVLALTRIICPTVNIPATTALATVNTREGRILALKRGANVIMPNLTPTKYKKLYEIYPGKSSADEPPEIIHQSIMKIIEKAGRKVGTGMGNRKKIIDM
ncbi:MAG TPA: [FeFe] hydrogenase H-cluster radical SAM maturase HydE [Candidatus Hydrogenedens sp.]|nr:[FeFe] hydrogenase H-cluster radical SAM maturase HydE [Candidatus Hydrogenedens sp.]